MTLFSFWTLLALGTVVLAARGPVGPRSWIDAGLLAAGFMSGLAVSLSGWSVEPAALALLVATLAGIQLSRPSSRAAATVATIGAGFLSAQAAAFVAAQGAPLVVSLVSSGLLTSVSFASARRPAFAPEPVREEALLFLMAFGVVMAAAPEVVSGWNSAMALNAAALPSGGEAIPGWVWIGVGAAIMAGALSRWWRRN